MSENYKRNPNTVCVVCNKPIYKRPSQLQLNKGRAFCGITCYGISSRKEKPCVVCGKMLMSHFNKKTCSRACSNILRTGIKYHQGRPKDKVVYYLSLKKRLLKLRGDKCEKCDYDKVQILQVHHKDRNRENNSLANLELICPNCHSEEHHLTERRPLHFGHLKQSLYPLISH